MTDNLTKPETTHRLRMIPVAPGAGRGMCCCGWASMISDDGRMFQPGYYSPADIERDWHRHAGQDRRGLPVIRVQAGSAPHAK